MSDNLPFEIQIEIMKRLPVKPLLQFRSVSKGWKSMIDSSHFIAHYSNTQVQHLLVNYYDCSPYENHEYVSIIEDATFPQQKVFPFVPESVNMLLSSRIIGCSNGLLCLNGYAYCPEDCDDVNYEKDMAVLWNIALRKAVAVVVPYAGHGYSNLIGFGVCLETNDPKIVNIKHIDDWGRNRKVISSIPWQVEVFTLSTGVWRSVYNNLPRMSVELFGSQVVIYEFLYWLAADKITMYGGFRSYNMIISFDITKEEFSQVNLPDSLAHDRSHENLYISKLRKSLVVLERDGVADNPSFIVWMMEDGISKSFTKLFTIYIPDAYIVGVPGFRKNGEPILSVAELNRSRPFYDTSLVVYEPHKKSIENIGIDGEFEFSVSSYMETLHLHDQPNSIIYYKGKRFISKEMSLEEFEVYKQ